jgi:hypothetical protein
MFKIPHSSPKNHISQKPKGLPSLRIMCDEVSLNQFRKLAVITVISLILQKYEGCWESNAFMNVSHTSIVTLKWNLSQLVHCFFSFSLLWGTVW